MLDVGTGIINYMKIKILILFIIILGVGGLLWWFQSSKTLDKSNNVSALPESKVNTSFDINTQPENTLVQTEPRPQPQKQTPTSSKISQNNPTPPLTNSPPAINQKPKCVSNISPIFTEHITDMSKVKYIVPPPTMGAGPSLKPHGYIGTEGKKVPIYAPVNMKVKSGSHYIGGPYSLNFEVSCEVTVHFGHVTDPIDSFKNLLPTEPKTDSRTQELSGVSFLAGDLIAYTTGTSQAGNWDFGVYNSATSNRYASDPDWNNSSSYTTAVCPFEYFTSNLKEAYISKFNFTFMSGNPPHGESFCK